MKELTDFPKMQCPFIRKEFEVDYADWRRYGNQYQLRQPKVYLAVNEINPGYEWVFDDPATQAIEKLDGTNVKLETEDGFLTALMNRKNIINPLQIMKGKTFIIEGVFMAIQKGYVEKNGEQAGEVIGPKLQGNPYNLQSHIWYPFEKAFKHLYYRSWHEHERTYENLSSWFKDFLFSRFATKRGEKDIMAEGVIFTNYQRRLLNKPWRAKLRRDMFAWFYQPDITIGDELLF